MFTDGVYEIKTVQNLGDIFKIMLKRSVDEKLVQKPSTLITIMVLRRVTAQQVGIFKRLYRWIHKYAVFNQNELMKVRELKSVQEQLKSC